MLRKLLRYDFKAVLKYWWIAAVSVLVLSVLGGSCISVMTSEKDLPEVAMAMATIGMMLVVLSYGVLAFLTMILIFIRFYKNFFSDEGYLTFTLPVKRTQLLNSKLIASVTTMCITIFVLFLGVLVMLAVGFAEEVFTQQFWTDFWEGIRGLFAELSGAELSYLLTYIVEVLLLMVLAEVFSCLFLFNCITFGSIITKKAKVIASIGIYYGVNSVLSFVIQLFYLFSIPALGYWISNLSQAQGMPVLALILLGIDLLVALLCSLLYCLEYWMLDRKLNLS